MREKTGWVVFSVRNLIIFKAVFIIGIFVHGSRFFTVYLAHDDITLAYPGTTFTSGRWFLQYLYILEMKIMGSHINAKGFAAIISLALIAAICCVIARDLKLKSTKSLILLSAVVITFPYVTSLFSYTYTAAYYNLSLLMAVVAASFIQSTVRVGKEWFRITGAVILLGLSMAVYQTSLCTFIAYMITLAIKESFNKENELWKDFALRCGSYLFCCVSGCLFYVVSNKAVLLYKGLEMSSYQGLDQMSHITISQFIKRITIAYKEFFFPSSGNSYSLYNVNPIRWCYRFVLAALIVFAVIFIAEAIKKNYWNKTIQLLLLFCVVPLAINSVFLTADTESTNIYSLMMFGEVFVFVCLVFALEFVKWGENAADEKRTGFVRAGCKFSALLLVYVSLYFGYTANVCYTKAAIQQEQTIGYFNRMITRIQSLDGYADSIPVAYINGRKKNEENLPLQVFDDLYRITPYNFSSNINLYNWTSYMGMWCGYSPVEVSREELTALMELTEVKEMPCYPDSGSIKIINGAVVIKFSE